MKVRSSALLNTNDSVTMHLLLQTAIGDSQGYEVLSVEEVDELKREYSYLQNRVEATRRKLTLETKLRDAAQSLNRLYSPTQREGSLQPSPNPVKKHRRSFMGSRGSGSDLFAKTDDELSVSTKKCDELAQELSRFERRAQEVHARLLQHAAGVLQMTHRSVMRKGQSPDIMPALYEDGNGYDYGSGATPLTDGVSEFDHRSFYHGLEGSDEFAGVHGWSANGVSAGAVPPGNADFEQQKEAILLTEAKLEDLNHRLKELILRTNDQSKNNQMPPRRPDDVHDQQPGITLQAQLEYLEHGLETIQAQHNDATSTSANSTNAIQRRLENINVQLHDLLQDEASQHSHVPQMAPRPDGKDVETQMEYLEDCLQSIGERLQDSAHATHASSSRDMEHREKVERLDTVIRGLWDIMAGRNGAAGQGGPRSRGISTEPESPSEEPFSLQAFSAKVQSLYTRSSALQEQKDILTRQVQQQRDLNAKSDSEKEAKVFELDGELQGARSALNASSRETEELRDELAVATRHLETARQEATRREQQGTITESNALRAEREAREELEERLTTEMTQKQDDIARLQNELHDVMDDAGIARAEMQGSEARVKELVEQLEEMARSKADTEREEAELRAQLSAKAKEAEAVLAETSRLEGEVVRLQTEVTVARAELDGAYGTRAQRAAEVAANPALQKELDELGERNASLQDQIDTLRKELAETIADYESMTKATIEFEKEREQLENLIDNVRDKCEALETELSEEKLKCLGMKGPGGPVETTSTMVLKNEFKKMMRDTRAENNKVLRVSPSVMGLAGKGVADFCSIGRTGRAAKVGGSRAQSEEGSDAGSVRFESEHDRPMTHIPPHHRRHDGSSRAGI